MTYMNDLNHHFNDVEGLKTASKKNFKDMLR